MTLPPSLVGLFIAPLNRAGIDYMVTGGLAAIVYGHPRMTLDVDLVIRLGMDGASSFAAIWQQEEFYCPPPEVIAEEVARTEHDHFNVIHKDSALRADVYLSGTDHLHAWGLAHRVERFVQREIVQFAPIEYVIVYKLRYIQRGGSDRHLRDIVRMLEVSAANINQSALDQWIAKLNLGPEWTKARIYSEPD